MGKSSALGAGFARIKESCEGTDDRGALIDLGAVACIGDLRSEIENHTEVLAWRCVGRGVMNLYLDSLDEAIPTYPAISKGLMAVIRALGRERLRLSITCRTGEFPAFFENQLVEHFEAQNVTRWQLAPLTRSDIRIATTENDLDSDTFMDAAREGNLQPLAARPITLDLLVRTARSGGGLLKDVGELYARGCRELIGERSSSSRSTQGRLLDSDQGMAIAGRVACVTVFGARTIVNAETGADGQPGAATASEIAGDRETANGNRFAVTEASVLEVLRTGLFTASGLRFRWVHKSYAEFLAAWHIRASSMPTRNKVLLVTSEGRVPSPLRGVAGWLASLDGEVFSEILRMDPEATLLADLSLATDDQKAEIVAWLLRQAESGSPLVHDWDVTWRYRGLKHQNLAAQLEPVIEHSPLPSARYCAIQIADACQEGDLQASLASLALRPDEPIHLRIAAASSVADHGAPTVKARLLPLAVQKDLPVDEQRLQVPALTAVWPESCSWAELRESIGVSDHSLTGPLGRFIGFDLPEKMKPTDWPEALRWLSLQEHPVDGLSAWGKCGNQIMRRTATSGNNSDLDGAIVDLLQSRLSKHEKMFDEPNFGGSEHMPWPEDRRRWISAALVPRLVPNLYAAAEMVRRANPLLIRSDFEFAAERWQIAPADEKRLWEAIVGYLVNWEDLSNVATSLTTAQRFPDLHRYLLQWQADLQKRQDRDRQQSTEREEARASTRNERMQQIRELLAAAQGDYRLFWHLLLAMAFPLDETCGYWPSTAIHKLPGWGILSGGERDQVLRAGKLFINEARPYPFPGLRDGNPTNFSIAGFWVFFELFMQEPAYLDNLPANVWKRWTPGIISVQCNMWEEDHAAVNRGLLVLCANEAELTAIRALTISLRAGRALRVTPVMQAVGGAFSSKKFDERVLQGLRSLKVAGEAFLAGMRLLIQRGYGKAIGFLDETIGRIGTAPDAELPQLARGVALLLHYKGRAVWQEVWQELQARPTFADALLAELGNGGCWASGMDRLSDEEFAALYTWLRKEFGINPEVPSFGGRPEWTSQGTILTTLLQRVQPESVATLELLARNFSDDWIVRKAAWEGRRQLLDSRWTPLSPGGIKRIVADRRQMIVRDEEELAEAIWQSLIDYQASIRSEGGRGMRLWNEPAHTPKGEEPISREIGTELQEMLLGRGVSVTCETKIREGQYVDLYVGAVIPGAEARKLSLIIEVKGCWNRELMSALESQLAMRYLRDNLSSQGIYLVAWFLCDRWNGDNDYRKNLSPKTTLADLSSLLESQAQHVNAETGSEIRVFILDATIEGASPHPRVKRKKGIKQPAKRRLKRSR